MWPQLDTVLKPPGDLVIEPVIHEPVGTRLNAEYGHSDGVRCAELRCPHVPRTRLAKWRFAQNRRCGHDQLGVQAVGGINAGHPDDVAAGLDTALDEPTATEGLEANPENFVGTTQVVGQSIETALVGARHPPETCLPLEDIQRPLVAGSGKARGQDAHLRGHAKLFFAIDGVSP